MTDNVVIKVPIFDYFTLPDVIKHCVGNNEWNEGKFSVEIEEIYVNEILEHVVLYFGNTANVSKRFGVLLKCFFRLRRKKRRTSYFNLYLKNLTNR